MNCSDARHLIHLDVGNDLESDEKRRMAAHVEHCGECRAYHSGMLNAMTAIHRLRDFDPPIESSARSSAGVWQGVAAKLPARQRRLATPKQFNLRVAALCVCSLALAVVTIVRNLPVANVTQPTPFGASVRMASNPFGTTDNPGTVMRVSSGGIRFSEPSPQLAPGSRIQILNPDGTVAGNFEWTAPSAPRGVNDESSQSLPQSF